MNIFKTIAQSWSTFKKEVSYSGQKFFSLSEARETSTKASTGNTTYDRYDPEHGLHDEPVKPE